MKVIINSKETEIQAKTVKELAQELDLPATGCAVAISNEIADRKQTQETQKRYDTDFRRIDKMCRLRMVFSLWGKQAEQKPIRVLPLQQKRTGITPVFHALYPL